MKRHSIQPREQWQDIVESQGLYYHTINGEVYWQENAYYNFTEADVALISYATRELHLLCLEAVDYVIRNGLYSRFGLGDWIIPTIEASWKSKQPDLYGRFDFVYFDSKFPPKMLEYNADTPTSLLESSVIQYHWAHAQFPDANQFNCIHESLIQRWHTIAEEAGLLSEVFYFLFSPNDLEDMGNTDYMRATAEQAGLKSIFMTLDQTGWDTSQRQFTDVIRNNRPIQALFKLYPWEWLDSEHHPTSFVPQSDTLVIEPSWKMLLSNKALLPLLWELFPNHPNLLPAYPVPDPLVTGYVRKPLLSREGANIEIVDANGEIRERTEGEYGKEGFIYQSFYPIRPFEGHFPLIGSWVVGGKPVGIGIREDNSLITKNTSCFVPHIIS